MADRLNKLKMTLPLAWSGRPSLRRRRLSSDTSPTSTGYEVFRRTCGAFVFTLSYVLFKKEIKAKAKIRGLKMPNRVSGFLIEFVFVYFFWDGWLLQCGDVEPNPGPKSTNTSSAKSKYVPSLEIEPIAGPKALNTTFSSSLGERKRFNDHNLKCIMQRDLCPKVEDLRNT